ncbi:uncharacterized protein METZ01_LOCUS340778, partial [marine metagenome]
RSIDSSGRHGRILEMGGRSVRGKPCGARCRECRSFFQGYLIPELGQTLGCGRCRQALRQVEFVRGRKSEERGKYHRAQGKVNIRRLRQQRCFAGWQELLHLLHSDRDFGPGQI